MADQSFATRAVVPAISIAARVVALLVAAGTASGYVLFLGGVTVWMRLDGAGLPTQMPLARADRGELFMIGAEVTALWIGLVALLAIAAAAASLLDGDDLASVGIGLVAGAVIAAAVLGLLEVNTDWVRIAGVALVGLAVAAVAAWIASDDVGTLLILGGPAALGAGAAYLVWRLAENNRFWTVGGLALVVAAGALAAGLASRRRHPKQLPPATHRDDPHDPSNAAAYLAERERDLDEWARDLERRTSRLEDREERLETQFDLAHGGEGDVRALAERLEQVRSERHDLREQRENTSGGSAGATWGAGNSGEAGSTRRDRAAR